MVLLIIVADTVGAVALLASVPRQTRNREGVATVASLLLIAGVILAVISR